MEQFQNKPVLVILAAGMGSRFGGIKQMAEVGHSGEWLLDFSLYDAWLAGFRQVIFVIRPEMEREFSASVEPRFGHFFDIRYAKQTLPDELGPSNRQKPLGTGHALICAAEMIDGPFGVINADDYYGSDAYIRLYQWLSSRCENIVDAKGEDPFAIKGRIIAYPLSRTLSPYGGVSRGICKITNEGLLSEISERTSIKRTENGWIQDESGEKWPENQLVSMNIWGFDRTFLERLKQYYVEFIGSDFQREPEKAEFYLPKAVQTAIERSILYVSIDQTEGSWTGVTYPEDLAGVRAYLNGLQNQGQYPARLWDEPRLKALRAAEGFFDPSNIKKIEAISTGHINQTWIVTVSCDVPRRYVLQKLNTTVFTQPEMVMENIMKVTKHLDADSTLAFLNSKQGKAWFVHSQLGFWRCYRCIENCRIAGETSGIKDIESAGEAFGDFLGSLSNFPAEELYEVIPHFHDTPQRYDALIEAVGEDLAERVRSVEPELQLARRFEPYLDMLMQGLKTGSLPLRVTHNDTKVNNVLLDMDTGKGVVVIDLDTVMPGTLLFDYGDGIRSTISTAAEDEENLAMVFIDQMRFASFTRGFLRGAGNRLSHEEFRLMVWGAILMTYECGIRFLTDYLNGDVYFAVHKPDHNLYRARTQLKLAQEMLEKREMLEMIASEMASGKGTSREEDSDGKYK